MVEKGIKMKIEIRNMRHEIGQYAMLSRSLRFTASVYIDGKYADDLIAVIKRWHGKEENIRDYYPMIKDNMIGWITKDLERMCKG